MMSLLRIEYYSLFRGGTVSVSGEPPCGQTSYNVHLFHEGTERRAYEFMGAHPLKDGMHGCAFRVDAHANVYVQGDLTAGPAEIPWRN